MTLPPIARRVLGAGVVAGLAYGIFLRHRPDYLGHYVAGFGATQALLGLVWVRTKTSLGWQALALTTIAIVLGFITEQTIFRVVFFDPIDFSNQSLGACTACACSLDPEWERSTAPWLIALSGVFLLAGFAFAFA